MVAAFVQEAHEPGTSHRRITPYAAGVIASTKACSESETRAPDAQPLSIEDLLDAPVPVHESWELGPMVEAVVSVGFDITLGLNYLGQGDPVMGLISSRDSLESVIEDALDK